MALFNDGPIHRIEELALYDSSLLETATIERIDVGAKIAGAQAAIGTEVLTFLLDNESVEPVFGGGGGRRATLGITDVVVTAELKRWHAFRTLQAVYQDANGSQSNDRYQWKWKEYGALAGTAKAGCLDIGIGLAADPIPKAQTPFVTTVAGSGAGGTLYFAAALVNGAGQEGMVSDVVMANLPPSMQADVHLTTAPANARGWNIYAGNAPGLFLKQNDAVLDVSATWTQPEPLNAGSAPTGGQRPTFWAVQNRVIRRG